MLRSWSSCQVKVEGSRSHNETSGHARSSIHNLAVLDQQAKFPGKGGLGKGFNRCKKKPPIFFLHFFCAYLGIVAAFFQRVFTEVSGGGSFRRGDRLLLRMSEVKEDLILVFAVRYRGPLVKGEEEEDDEKEEDEEEQKEDSKKEDKAHQGDKKGHHKKHRNLQKENSSHGRKGGGKASGGRTTTPAPPTRVTGPPRNNQILQLVGGKRGKVKEKGAVKPQPPEAKKSTTGSKRKKELGTTPGPFKAKKKDQKDKFPLVEIEGEDKEEGDDDDDLEDELDDDEYDDYEEYDEGEGEDKDKVEDNVLGPGGKKAGPGLKRHFAKRKAD